MPEERTFSNHSLIMENRKQLTLTGVSDVCSFDENSVTMQTAMGELAVKGSELRISGFNRETGEISMEGNVYALVYTDDRREGGSFFRRILR